MAPAMPCKIAKNEGMVSPTKFAVSVNTSQEAADEFRQSSVLEHGEDTRVVDTVKGSSKVGQKSLILAECTQHESRPWSRSQKCCPSCAWK